jgi:hypothetical protein
MAYAGFGTPGYPGYGYGYGFGNGWFIWALLLVVLAFAFFPGIRGWFGF